MRCSQLECDFLVEGEGASRVESVIEARRELEQQTRFALYGLLRPAMQGLGSVQTVCPSDMKRRASLSEAFKKRLFLLPRPNNLQTTRPKFVARPSEAVALHVVA
jgi:hypothetical protein